MGHCCCRLSDSEKQGLTVTPNQTHFTNIGNDIEMSRKGTRSNKRNAAGTAANSPPKRTRRRVREIPEDDLNTMLNDINVYRRDLEKALDKGKKDKETLRDFEEQVKQLQGENDHLSRLMKEEKKKVYEIDKLQKELKRVTEENDALILRVSSMAGAALTNNNPNIADLSDANRPTKLAEQYSELYDNEWTDAFSALDGSGISENKTIQILLTILTETYKLCEDKATSQMEGLITSMAAFLKNPVIPASMIKPFKETRKGSYKSFLPDLHQEQQAQLSSHFNQGILDKTRAFRERCLELCWLICIQDPPIVMDCNVHLHGQHFDKSAYRTYTATGPYVDFVVWPVLYLYEKGDLLSKGVAQATSSAITGSGITSDRPQATTFAAAGSEVTSDRPQVTGSGIATRIAVAVKSPNTEFGRSQVGNVTQQRGNIETRTTGRVTYIKVDGNRL